MNRTELFGQVGVMKDSSPWSKMLQRSGMWWLMTPQALESTGPGCGLWSWPGHLTSTSSSVTWKKYPLHYGNSGGIR